MAFFNTERMYDRFNVSRPNKPLKDSYNVYPGQKTPAIFYDGDKKVGLKQFGFELPWSKKPIFNARMETITEKSTFSKKLRESRCLIPASKYFEWQTTTGGKKEYEHEVDDGEIFSMAAVCDGEAFAIITTEPWKKLARIHNRMPVVMQRDFEDEWLNPDLRETDQILKLLIPLASKHIAFHAI